MAKGPSPPAPTAPTPWFPRSEKMMVTVVTRIKSGKPFTKVDTDNIPEGCPTGLCCFNHASINSDKTTWTWRAKNGNTARDNGTRGCCRSDGIFQEQVEVNGLIKGQQDNEGNGAEQRK